MEEMTRYLRCGRAIRKWFVDPIARALFATGFKITIKGDLPPPEMACIWVCNHSSHFEPVIACAVARVPLHAMAMVELFSSPFRRFFLTLMLTIPVDRSRADTSALRAAVRRLKSGQQVLLFPEGGIRVGRESIAFRKEPLFSGAAYLAVFSGVPVFPVLITEGRRGYQRRTWLGRRAHSFVYCGDLISPLPREGESKKESISRINGEILDALQDLLKQIS
jgi:1-acyl-sn-glycerol-3-phosphate acyltransferase